MKRYIYILLLILTQFSTARSGLSEEDTGATLRTIQLAKADRKVDVNSYFGIHAHGATQLFYQFNPQSAAVQITMDNASPQIQPKVRIVIFDTGSKPTQVEHWINNRHSDAIYPDAAKPIATIDVDSKHIQTTVKGPFEHSRSGAGDEYDRYTVDVSISPFAVEQVNFEKSSCSAEVFVKLKK